MGGGHGPDWVVPAVAQLLLFSLITGMAASVDTRALRDRFRRCCGVALGLSFQFLLLPFVGFLTVKALRLPAVHGVALLAVTASPGGAYSNWWCSLFNADLALSIAMTTCSTIASVAVTPVNLAVYMRAAYGEVPALNFGRLVGSIAVAVAAILTGLGISFFFPKRRGIFNKWGNVAGLALIIFSAFVSSGSDEPLWEQTPRFYVATALPCVLGLLGSFVCSMIAPCLSRPEAVSVTVETCYQNTGLALTIALASFEGADRSRAACVPLVYGVVQVIILPIFLLISWKCGLTYAPKHEPIHRVVLMTWQPVQAADGQVLAVGDGLEGGKLDPEAGELTPATPAKAWAEVVPHDGDQGRGILGHGAQGVANWKGDRQDVEDAPGDSPTQEPDSSPELDRSAGSGFLGAGTPGSALSPPGVVLEGEGGEDAA